MNQIILASHGNLAKGMKDTLNIIIGNVDNVEAFSSYRDDEYSLRESIEKIIKDSYTSLDIYILTDIFGGSVNNDLMPLVRKYPKIHLISGMNLSLAISIATSNKIEESLIEELIKDSKESIIYCNELINKYKEECEEIYD